MLPVLLRDLEISEDKKEDEVLLSMFGEVLGGALICDKGILLKL